MKNFIISAYIFLIAFFTFGMNLVSAQDLNPNASQNQKNYLEIISVRPIYSQEIELIFSEAIDISSLRALIENVITRESVEIREYLPAKSDNAVRIILQNPLQANASYRITVTSVISKTGKTISIGMDAIREFVSPNSLEAAPTQDAPENINVNAVMSVKAPDNQGTLSGSTLSGVQNTSQSEKITAVGSGEIKTILNADKKLPETGSPLVFIAVLIAILGGFVAIFSERHS